MKSLSLGIFGVAAALAAAPSGAQEPVLALDDVVEVNVVNVDVVVTDREGRPVPGLTRADFRLREDGDPAEIVNFLEVSGPDPTAVVSEGAEPAPRPAAGSDPVTVVLYFDNSTLIQAHRNRVLPNVRDFVERAAGEGEARFLVVAFDRRLELVEPLTGDPRRVLAAIDRVEGMPASGLEAERERQSARDQVQAIYIEVETSKGYGPLDGEPGPGNRRGKESASTQGTRSRFFDVCTEAWGPMLNAVDSFAQAEAHRVDVARSGLVDLTRSLSGVPGRKVVLYLSDGLAQIPGQLEYQILGQICPDRTSEIFSYYSRFERAGALEELTALANLNRVTFYALDTTGLAGVETASARSDDQRFMPSFQNQSAHRENLRASLFTMADETGGRAFFNANQPGPELERMARDYSNYYSLGFTPRAGWDGKAHKLKVELVDRADRGYRLLYRARYRALPQAERVAERTLAALILGVGQNPLDVRLRTALPSRLEDGRFLVPLEISVALERVTSLPAAGARQGQLRLVLAIEGPDGDVPALREMVVPLELPAVASGSGERHSMVIRLPLEPGSGRIAVAVEDRLASVVSYLSADPGLPAVEPRAGKGRRKGRSG